MLLQTLRHGLCGLFLFATACQALKFDLHATNGHPRCIRNFVTKDTLVVVTATVGGSKGDGMLVNMHVSTETGRQCRQGIALTTLPDQGCCRQRVRPRQGHCRRAAHRLHVTRGRSF